MAGIEVWNGDICDLEVDAIVAPAVGSLWMSTGVGGAIKRAGGDAIEFAAIRQAPVELGRAIMTPAGTLAARAVIHAVSLDRDRRTSAETLEAAVRSAMARAREMGATSIAAAGISVPARHVAASAAVITGGVDTHGAIRPGLSIYGLVPDELAPEAVPVEVSDGLRPVMALYARPVRVLDLPEGWGISYGPTFRTPRPGRIATLPFGYGDGWSRRLSNRAAAIVRGVRVPLVGNVAMDAVMADVTDVPGPPVDPGDEFVLIGEAGGERITVADLAHERTTNSWEVVTGMARRLPRVYHAAAGPVGLRALTERST